MAVVEEGTRGSVIPGGNSLVAVTYEGPDVVTMTVTSIGFSLSLTSPQIAAALRGLAG